VSCVGAKGFCKYATELGIDANAGHVMIGDQKVDGLTVGGPDRLCRVGAVGLMHRETVLFQYSTAHGANGKVVIDQENCVGVFLVAHFNIDLSASRGASETGSVRPDSRCSLCRELAPLGLGFWFGGQSGPAFGPCAE